MMKSKKKMIKEERKKRSLIHYRKVILEHVHNDDRYENAVFMIIIGFSVIGFIYYLLYW